MNEKREIICIKNKGGEMKIIKEWKNITFQEIEYQSGNRYIGIVEKGKPKGYTLGGGGEFIFDKLKVCYQIENVKEEE